MSNEEIYDLFFDLIDLEWTAEEQAMLEYSQLDAINDDPLWVGEWWKEQ